ncbi:hypothetical protein J7E62_24525 [Variovorax paradoxus]|nr:hypothetical protein [Variovorax paradoxus]
MKPGWRFRSGWRGVLVLQRYVEWRAHDAYDSWDAAAWRDATTEDLTDFFKENAHEQLPTA